MAGLAALIVVGMWAVVNIQIAKAVENTIDGAGTGYVRMLHAQGQEFRSLMSEPVFVQTVQIALQPGSATQPRYRGIREAHERLLNHFNYPGGGSPVFHPAGQVATFEQMLEDLQWMYLAEEAQRGSLPEESRASLLGNDWATKRNMRSRAPMQANLDRLTPSGWNPQSGGTSLANIERVIKPDDRADKRLLYRLATSVLEFHRRDVSARMDEVTVGGASAQVVGLLFQPAISSLPFLDRLESAAGTGATEATPDRGRMFRVEAGISEITARGEELATSDPNVRFREGSAAVGGGSSRSNVVVREYIRQGEDNVRVFLNAEVLGRAQADATRMIGIAAVVAILIAIGVAFLVGLGLTRPVVSLMHDVEVIASGNFDHRPRITSRDEVGTLAELLGEMAVSLKVGQDAWRLNQVQSRDLEMAREVQENLLAKHVPAVPQFDISAYYSPSREVGGDYFDFFQVTDERLGMVVADVSGKGVPGSMIMMMAKALITYEAMAHSAPKQLFKTVNRFLARDIKRGMFVTAFYIELDIPSKVIRVASAGHVPMLIFRESTRKPASVNPGGLALGFDRDGVLFERNMKEEAIQLQTGDRVVIYTDGVTEAKSPAGEEFGEQRVIQIMSQCSGRPSQEFLNTLVQAIESHTQSSVQQDDITLITFRVE
jgi:HAMP domain-containing protein